MTLVVGVQLTSIIAGWLALPIALWRLHPVIHYPGTKRRHVRLLASLAILAALISLAAGVILADRYGWLSVGWRASVLLVVLAVARRAVHTHPVAERGTPGGPRGRAGPAPRLRSPWAPAQHDLHRRR